MRTFDIRGLSVSARANLGDRVETCKSKTVDCERAAVLVTDQRLQKVYLDLARQWREMAEEVEFLDHKRGVGSAVGSKELRL